MDVQRDQRRSLGINGLWVPIVTPFTTDGEVDERSLRSLAEGLLAAGAAGLVPLGTTGEAATLSSHERQRVVAICGEASRDADRAMIVGAGSNDTAACHEEIQMVADRGANAALMVVPYYTRPSRQAVLEHFTALADASPVPLIVYNIPYRTGRGLRAADVLAAAEHPNIIGLKQSVGALDADTLTILANSPSGFDVLAGDDAFIGPTLLMGGSGAIAAAAHVCTSFFVDLVASALTGDSGRTAIMSGLLLEVVTSGFAEPSPAVWKGALAEAGHIASDRVRRPMAEASAEAVLRLQKAMREAERLLA